ATTCAPSCDRRSSGYSFGTDIRRTSSPRRSAWSSSRWRRWPRTTQPNGHPPDDGSPDHALCGSEWSRSWTAAAGGLPDRVTVTGSAVVPPLVGRGTGCVERPPQAGRTVSGNHVFADRASDHLAGDQSVRWWYLHGWFVGVVVEDQSLLERGDL